jgi:hypothetical protein
MQTVQHRNRHEFAAQQSMAGSESGIPFNP